MAADAGSGLALRPGSRLDELEIAAEIHEDPFAIVYLAHDHTLDRRVAVKEYLPQALCERDGSNQVRRKDERYRGAFETLRERFVEEARLLARFDHPALLRVYRARSHTSHTGR